MPPIPALKFSDSMAGLLGFTAEAVLFLGVINRPQGIEFI